MSAQAKDKSQVVAALAQLGLSKSQVLAIFADDETPGSSPAVTQHPTTSEHRPPPGNLDSQNSTRFAAPSSTFPPQQVATPTHVQYGGLPSRVLPTTTPDYASSAAIQGHAAPSAVPLARPGAMEPGTGPQGSSVEAGLGFGHATEYFGGQAPPPLANGINGLRSLAAQPVLTPSNALPASGTAQSFQLPPVARGQWGAAGTVASQQPSHIPSPLTAMLAPSYGPVHAATASTTSSAPRFSTNSSLKRAPAPPRNRPINHIDKVIIIPAPQYDRYLPCLAYACQRSQLSRPISLETGFSREVVFQTLKAKFQDVLDLEVYPFEWMYLTQQTGDHLVEAGIPVLPCGTDIAKAYKRKSLIFLRLRFSAVPSLPLFKTHIQRRCLELGKSAARLLNDPDLLEDGEDMEDTASEVEDGEFSCDKCGGVFLSSSRVAHLTKCLGSCKRTASARHATTGPADPSSSPERTRRQPKRTKPLGNVPPPPHATSSNNSKIRRRSAKPAAAAFGGNGEEIYQLGEDSGKGGDEEDQDQDDGDENEGGDEDNNNDDEYQPEEEDDVFADGFGGDMWAGRCRF